MDSLSLGNVVTTKASISSGYKWRLGIIALACLGFSTWFFYDGAVKYPAKQAIHQTYLRIQEEHPTDFNTRWVERARDEGWPTTPPEPYTDMDITTQYIFALLVLPVGLAFLWAFVRALARWISADESGLHTSWGAQAPWDAIRSIDKQRWKTKGIAVVHYDDGGTSRKVTLDDWKYEREPTVAIVAMVDQRLGNTASAESEAAMTPADREAQELSRQ